MSATGVIIAMYDAAKKIYRAVAASDTDSVVDWNYNSTNADLYSRQTIPFEFGGKVHNVDAHVMFASGKPFAALIPAELFNGGAKPVKKRRVDPQSILS